MRNFYMFLVLAALLASGTAGASAANPRKAWSDTENAFLLKTSDGLEQDTVKGTITFKAVADGSNIPSYRDAGVVFIPANEGEIIQITVNSCDLAEPNYLLLYDGAIEKIGYGTSDGSGQSTYLPAGWVQKIIAGSEGLTYASTSDDGKLSFGFHSTSPAGQTGWNITVTSISPKDMEYVSTDVLTDLADTWRGAKDAPIFGVNVKMDGGGNPMTLNALSIDGSALAGSTAVGNIRLTRKGDVIATASQPGDNLSVTDVTLNAGDNQFVVIADIAPDASGSIPSMAIRQVTVAGAERVPLSTTAQAVNIENKILMPAVPTTFTIGDDAAFYDDGGADGKITLNFNGTATFVPATEGYAIKIDFSKLAIFNTSTVGRNDILKFYNGREANEANLITTLLTDAEMVKSTADDGSMTVTLVSTTGVPADGWEATVSQFLPGDMTFKEVTAEAVEGTVAAGDTDAQMLVVDVVTDNQANPLTLTAINLTTPDAKNLAKVRAYYLGKKNTFSTATTFGEATPDGNAVALTGSQELAEGHNYFAVVADVATGALNGEQLTLALQDVAVAGAAQTPAAAAAATRTVSNICRATQGAHSHLISDAWTFTNTEGYSGKYETVNTDYIVTFTPAEAGHLAQIDFSNFDVYYSNSSYGTKAVFEIYAGNSVNVDNLLWQLNDNSQSAVGPGHTIRSTAADGSLTIRFNPNTTSSYYAGTGWTATVVPFQNHDMTFSHADVNQTSTDNVAVGTVDAEMIDFDVVTEGSLTTKTLTGVKLALTGAASLDSVKVLYSGSETSLDNAVEFGKAVVSGDEVVVAGSQALAEGHNHFWVRVNVKNDAEADAVIDASLTQLQFADGNETIAEGNPEGTRTVKYIYLLQPDDNSVITVINPLMFYDDGGADGKVTKGLKGTVTFVPGVDDSAVQINAEAFAIGSGRMYVYSGRELNDANLLGKPYYSTTSGPENLVSKADDGSLTIRYEGNTTATTLDGWAIAVSLHQKTPFTVDSIVATPNADDVNRNARAALMQQIKVCVSGDKNPVSVTALKFSAEGTTALADIAAAKVYCTGNIANYNPETPVGTLTTIADGENVIAFDTPVEIAENGEYYYWLAYDIAAGATVGDKVAATALSLITGETATDVTGTKAERTVKAGLNGTYVIGASQNADYANFAQATAALAGGVEGPVTFRVEDGTYAENVKVRNVPGAGQESPIVFEAYGDDASKVVISGTGSVDQTGDHKEGLFYVEQTPYVTVRNLTIATTTTGYGHLMHFYNQCRHATVEGVTISSPSVTSGYSGTNLLKAEGGPDNDMQNDYLTVKGCTFSGGYIAIAGGGQTNVMIPGFKQEKGMQVLNNTISEAGSKGIYIYDEADFTIDGNVITQTSTTRTGYNGVDLARASGKVIISNNKITNAHSAYSQGIYLRDDFHGNSPDEPALIFNNAIAVTNSPSTSGAGIQMPCSAYNVSLVNNTVSIAGSKGYTFYAARGTAFTDVKFVNNLLQNLTESNCMFIYSGMDSKPEFANNAFYTASADGYLNDDLTLDALNAYEGNSANTVEQAEFLSETDLHLKSAGNLCSGQPVDFVTTDADGVRRNATTPTIGAYEFVALDYGAPVLAEGYPTVTDITRTTASLKSKWDKSGKLYYIVEQAESGQPAPAAAPAAAPTADQLLQADAVNIQADVEAIAPLTDLQPATDYRVHMMAVSSLGTQSEVVTTDVFKTAYPELEVEVPQFADTIDAGGNALLTALVAGGAEPYTIEWTDQMNQTVGSELNLTVSPAYTYTYRLKVTGSDGQTATAKTTVIVRGAMQPATFDDNYLADESHLAPQTMGDWFTSGSFLFNGGAFPEYNYWYGYAVSNETATTYSTLADQFRGVAGSGNNSANYGVAYPEGMTVVVTNNAEGEVVNGAYVTNTAWVYDGLVNGDGMSDALAEGGYFKVIATGKHADGSTATSEFYLADYRPAQQSERYIISDWTWWDMTSLGAVTELTFRLDGSQRNAYGMTTPAYFCLEDLGDDNSHTGINTGARAGKTVESVSYVNLAGMESDKPFEGVNIVVTRYTDGTQATAKQIIR